MSLEGSKKAYVLESSGGQSSFSAFNTSFFTALFTPPLSSGELGSSPTAGNLAIPANGIGTLLQEAALLGRNLEILPRLSANILLNVLEKGAELDALTERASDRERRLKSEGRVMGCGVTTCGEVLNNTGDW